MYKRQNYIYTHPITDTEQDIIISFTLLKVKDLSLIHIFDKAGRAMGLEYPGGVSIDKISKSGDPNAYSFPHPKVDGCLLYTSTRQGQSKRTEARSTRRALTAAGFIP